jgi:glycerate kinase
MGYTPGAHVKCLLAPASFKGTFRAREIAGIWAEVLSDTYSYLHLDQAPVADGGSETLELLRAYIGGEEQYIRVPGPIGGFHDVGFLYNSTTRTGLVESSRVIGLELVPRKSRDPLIATSYPLGLVLKELLDLGARSVLVGLGDTATMDFGVGMAAALGFKFVDEFGRETLPGGMETVRVSHLDLAGAHPAVGKTQFKALADVITPLFGDISAARIFGPQKGAGEAEIDVLESGARSVIGTVLEKTGVDMSRVEMGGAAGGIAAMMKALLNAELVRGSRFVSKSLDLPGKVENADIILTGEGRLDLQTFEGKAVSEVIDLSRTSGKKVAVVCAAANAGIPVESTYLVITGERLGKRKESRLNGKDLAQLSVIAVEEMIGRAGR